MVSPLPLPSNHPGIQPILHHLPAFGKVSRPIVCSAVRVFDSVCKLMFNEIGADLEPFVKDRSRHCPEAVAGHFFLAESHAPQYRQDGIFTHRTGEGSTGRENVPGSAGKGLKLF
jgi:hypothetical protein